MLKPNFEKADALGIHRISKNQKYVLLSIYICTNRLLVDLKMSSMYFKSWFKVIFCPVCPTGLEGAMPKNELKLLVKQNYIHTTNDQVCELIILICVAGMSNEKLHIGRNLEVRNLEILRDIFFQCTKLRQPRGQRQLLENKQILRNILKI